MSTDTITSMVLLQIVADPSLNQPTLMNYCTQSSREGGKYSECTPNQGEPTFTQTIRGITKMTMSITITIKSIVSAH